METPDNRKRAASDDDINSADAATKRPRCHDAPPNNNNSSDRDETKDQDKEIHSVEAHFSVPLDFIFRQVPSPLTSSMTTPTKQRRKTLLTRSEARCLLSINHLAHEIDILIDVAARASERGRQSRSLRQQIESNANHPILRPVLVMLAVHGGQLVDKALLHVETELSNRILPELELHAKALRQFSEQNLTLSESLLDAFGEDSDDMRGCSSPSSGQLLAKEKRACGDIQEELYTRIEKMMESVKAANTSAIKEDLSISTLEINAAANAGVHHATAEHKSLELSEAIQRSVNETVEVEACMADFCSALLQDSLTPYGSSGISMDTTSVERDVRQHSNPSSPAASPPLDPVLERSSQVSPGSSKSGSERGRESPSANSKLGESSFYDTGPLHSPQRNAVTPFSSMAGTGIAVFAPAQTPENNHNREHSQAESPPASTQSAVEALTVLAYGGADHQN